MNKQILKILKMRQESYNKNSQRAGLLARNKTFLEELENVNKHIKKKFHQLKTRAEDVLQEISENNPLLRLDYPKTKASSDEDIKNLIEEIDKNFPKYLICAPSAWHVRILKEKPFDSELEKNILYKFVLLDILIELWEKFCGKWHIDPRWDAELKTLAKYQGPLIDIVIEDFIHDPLPISIKIGPWTSKEDLDNIWPKIQKIQKSKFYKEDASSVFARDICWYDLKRKFKLGDRQIAKLWFEHYPEDIDYLVIKRIKRKNKELKEENESELLAEIMSDSSLADLKEKFEIEREWYVFGKMGEAKFTPPFLTLIKNSIKKVERRISLLDLPPDSEPVQFISRYIRSNSILGDL